MEAEDLLREVLQYLKREDTSTPGIAASRKKQIIDGEETISLEGPEKRFLIAEKIEKFLHEK